jgi:hypothetical protein
MLTEQEIAEGWIEQLMVYAYPAYGQDSTPTKKQILQGWIPISQQQFDESPMLNDEMGWYDTLVKNVGPGQVYRLFYNPTTQKIRKSDARYVGLYQNDKQRQDWRRISDDFNQREDERKLALKDQKDDPLAEHFAALREEYRKRVGGSKRAFLVRLMWEITSR